MITLEPPRSMVPGAADLSEVEVWRAVGLSRAGLGRFLRVAQTAVGLRGEMSVLLSDDRTLRKLNREWRGKDKATDVLSFPAMEEMAGVYAGDLAVSLETAKRQAKEQKHDLRDEVRVLLLHGLLHLAGMDHEVDGGEMAAREAELRAKLRMKSGLIARSTGIREQGLGIRKSRDVQGAKVSRKSLEGRATAKASSRFSSGMTTRRTTTEAKALNAEDAKFKRDGRNGKQVRRKVAA